MKKIMIPAVLSLCFIACSNNKSTDTKLGSDSTIDVKTEHRNIGPGAGNAAGNSNVSPMALDTAPIGTNPAPVRDSSTEK